MDIYLSNDQGRLLNLALNELEKGDLFEKRLVLVPSPLFKSTLIQAFAERSIKKVCLDLEIMELYEGVHTLFQRDLQIPKAIDIKAAIVALFEKRGKIRNLQLLQRVTNECCKAAWHGAPVRKETSYQALVYSIWNELIEQHPNWHFPFQCMQQEKQIASYSRIVCVGFSTLPASFHHFFMRVAQEVKVSYYLLSPCMMFWTDIVSDNAAHKMQTHFEKLRPSEKQKITELLLDRNRLLANYGRAGQLFSKILEESSTQLCVKEAYEISKHLVQPDECYPETVTLTDRHPSLLESLKTDLVRLEGKREEKRAIPIDDTSVQIIRAPTKLREVELVYEKICRTASALSHQEPLGSASIIIVVPNLQEYEPYIERVFGASREKLPYQIVHSRLSTQNQPLLNAFLGCFELPEKRFSRHIFEKLFSCPAFCKKLQLEADDLVTIDHIFDKVNFRFAKDAGQRKKVALADGYDVGVVDGAGSWQDVEKFVIENWNSGSLDTTAATMLGRVLTQVRQLFDLPDRLMFSSWVSRARTLYEEYFLITHENKKESELIEEACIELEKSAYYQSSLELTSSAFRELLQSALEMCYEKRQSFIKAQVVCTDAIHTLPDAKIIALLGCNSSSLDENKRYFFIEALLAATHSLCMSYITYNYVDQTEELPTRFIEELIETIDENYCMGEKDPSTVIVHTGTLLPQFHAIPEKIPQAVAIHKPQSSKETIFLEFSDLQRAMRAPLRVYCQEVIGTKFSSPRSNSVGIGDLKRIYPELLQQDDSEFATRCNSSSKLSIGSVKEGYIEHLRQKRDELKSSIKRFGLHESMPLTMELTLNVKKPEEIRPHHWHLPAITVGNYTLVGTLSAQYREGIVVFGRKDMRSLVRIWPDIVLRAYLHELYEMLPGQTLFYVEEHKIEEVPALKSDIALQTVLEYTTSCKRFPLLLYPEWIEDLLDNKIPEVKTIDDQAMQFVMHSLSNNELQDAWRMSQEYAVKLFQEAVYARV